MEKIKCETKMKSGPYKVKYLYWLSCIKLFLTSQKDLSYVAIHVSSDGIRTVEDVSSPLVFNIGLWDTI